MMNIESIKIYNAKILTPLRFIPLGEVVTLEDQIVYVGPMKESSPPKNGKIFDAQGLYVAPGFIDIHVHGGGGKDVMDADPLSLAQIAATHAAGGTTSLLLTTSTAPLPRIRDALDAIEAAGRTAKTTTRILGAHLEGPYINPNYAGALNSEFIREPRKSEYLPILRKYRCIKRMTFAPELPGALELARELKSRGIVASIGHSGANYQEILKAIEVGCTHVTHMFSAMSGIKRIKGYRVTGIIESTLLLDELTTELIADGHHLPPSLLKLVVKSKGLDKVCLVTDAMAAAGLGPGNYTLGGLKVIVERDVPKTFEQIPPVNSYVARLEDRSAFAGSVATMNSLVHNIVRLGILPLQEAIKLVTISPAKILNLSHLGTLAPGAKADIVLFDEDLRVMMTIVDGRVVYLNPEFNDAF